MGAGEASSAQLGRGVRSPRWCGRPHNPPRPRGSNPARSQVRSRGGNLLPGQFCKVNLHMQLAGVSRCVHLVRRARTSSTGGRTHPLYPLAWSLVPLILGVAANGDRGTRLTAISLVVHFRANTKPRINWSNDLGACPRIAFAVDCLRLDLRASHPNLRTARHRRKACSGWVGQARLLWWQMEVRRSDGDVWA